MGIFIIAEVGINHNGDINIARQLIDVAKDAGCDAVKFQKRTVDVVYSKEYLDSPRESPWGNTQRDQKEGLEFGLDEYIEIDKHCKERQIEWFASAWDLESQYFLRQFDCRYNKVASAMLVYEDLIRSIAEEKKHTFISTGMSDHEEIQHAVEIFKASECPFELMHCVSTYPMYDEDANLKCINTLRERFKCDVGYSGHEIGLAVSYAAAAMGISSLERHITLSRAMYGSDQAASVEPNGLVQLVGAVRKIEKAMGTGNLSINPREVEIAQKLRAHLPKNYEIPEYVKEFALKQKEKTFTSS
jgi:N-acetylneuraminate synthase